jgi:SAM-dependent methyltransferase
MKESSEDDEFFPRAFEAAGLEVLLRSAVARRCGAGPEACADDEATWAGEETAADADSRLPPDQSRPIYRSLEEAERQASAGAALSELNRFWPPLRPLAHGFLRLARTITNPQGRWNRSVLEALWAVADGLGSLEGRVARLEETLTGVRSNLGNRVAQLEAGLAETGDNLRRRGAELEQVSVEVVGLCSLGGRVARLEETLAGLGTALQGCPQRPGGAGPAARERRDQSYLDFQNRFRGAPALIKQRLRVYLPLLRQAGLGGPDLPILDVGSGRGEWLELVREQGWVGWGLDTNQALAEECRRRGLTVVEGQALEYLLAQPDASLGAVTAIHVLEHLPPDHLARFLAETVRVLKPGGLAVFETPNPENVVVGACTFYIDATHQRPLHPEVLRHLAERSGFAAVQVLYLREQRVRDPLPLLADGHALAPHLNPLIEAANVRFFGAPDFAVVARKAACVRE